MGSPAIHIVNADFEKNVPKEQHLDYTIRKQILWQSATATDAELYAKEVEMIQAHRSNDPQIGYNRWPLCKVSPDNVITGTGLDAEHRSAAQLRNSTADDVTPIT